MTDRREATNREPVERRAAERGAFRDVLLFAVVLGGAALVNAVLGMLLVEMFESIQIRPAGGTEVAAAGS